MAQPKCCAVLSDSPTPGFIYAVALNVAGWPGRSSAVAVTVTCATAEASVVGIYTCPSNQIVRLI